MKHILLLVGLVLLVLATGRSGLGREHTSASHGSLFAQASAQALSQEFPDTQISFLLLDAHTGELLASRWDDLNTPVPLGSLAKPFVALAYGEQHDFHYPVHTCRGSKTGCWRPGGHGEMDLVSAIAYSCNSYFRVLTQDLGAADVSHTANRFGLELPDRQATRMDLAGLGPLWKISPLRMAHAYLEMLGNRDNPAVDQIHAGMELSARKGTGAEAFRALPHGTVMVKTGTATCTHFPHAPGDGFAIALAPVDDPRILLMVRVHGVPGSQAAKTAGQMIGRITE